MVCDSCIDGSGPALESGGVPASATQATWSSVGSQLPHCPYCGAFVSPRSGVCNNETRCPKYGSQVAETMEWPPEGVRFTTDRSKFGKPVSVQVPADGAQAEPVQAQPSQSSQPQPQVQPAETEVGGVTLTLEDGTKLTIPLPRDALKDLSAGALDGEAAQSALMGAMETPPIPRSRLPPRRSLRCSSGRRAGSRWSSCRWVRRRAN